VEVTERGRERDATVGQRKGLETEVVGSVDGIHVQSQRCCTVMKIEQQLKRKKKKGRKKLRNQRNSVNRRSM
jgi:hypothetical protein